MPLLISMFMMIRVMNLLNNKMPTTRTLPPIFHFSARFAEFLTADFAGQLFVWMACSIDVDMNITLGNTSHGPLAWDLDVAFPGFGVAEGLDGTRDVDVVIIAFLEVVAVFVCFGKREGLHGHGHNDEQETQKSHGTFLLVKV